MKAIILVPAAGTGRRMGAVVSKQYLHLNGKPILARTLELFQQHSQVEAIYPIVSAADLDYCQNEIIAPHNLSKVRRLIVGGAERQESVHNGLIALKEDGYIQAQRPILVHDGARPLFNPVLLDKLLMQIDQIGAAIVAVPVKDTIKRVRSESMVVDTTLARETLWQAQTPQGARYELLQQAYTVAAKGFSGTDDASLIEHIGQQVAIVLGDYRNIKITTPEDLVIATALLDSIKEKSA
jgi:2-C-methyl-D-erythritol 4-phosphate cytidylyltransferase